MVNLIIKDILILKKSLLIGAIYPVIFMFAYQEAGIAAFLVSVVAVTYILVLTACAYDDKNKSDILLNSLPIGRNLVVLSRYLSVYVFSLVGVIFYMAAYVLVNVANIPVKTSLLTIESVIAALFSVTLTNSIYFPVYYKMGYAKSKIVNFILFFSVFIGVNTLSGLIKKYSVEGTATGKFIESALEFLAGLSDLQIALGIVIIMLIIVSISYRLSLKFYKNKEF
jgi:ABC-2 type transport system permease protein